MHLSDHISNSLILHIAFLMDEATSVLLSVRLHANLIHSLRVSQLYQQGRLCQLGGEFCELEVFAKVLRASDKR